MLKAFGPIEDVRLIRNKATGESRCFAFVDFATVEEAAAFMEYYGGLLELDERTVQMDFSRQKEHPTGEYKDWLCAQVERIVLVFFDTDRYYSSVREATLLDALSVISAMHQNQQILLPRMS